MDPYIKITKKFTKKFGSKVINRQYFHRKTGLKTIIDVLSSMWKEDIHEKLKSIFFTANQKLIIPNKFSQLSIFWNKGLKWQEAQIRRAEYFHTTKSFQEKLLQRQCVQETLGFCIFFFQFIPLSIQPSQEMKLHLGGLHVF